MCGLVAMFSDQGDLSPEPIQAALQRLAHRGPDGEGVWISDDRRFALGHRRLAIIDLEGGAQPLRLPGRRLWAVINGEQYDFKSQRERLQDEGQHFATRSDSEVILALYARHGLDFVQFLRGEYAIAILDAELDRLVLVRDPFGVKPLFVARRSSDGALCAASEAKALHALGVPARLDHEALGQALSFQYLAPGRSLFEGISMLAPGHLLVCEKKQTRQYPWYPGTGAGAGAQEDPPGGRSVPGSDAASDAPSQREAQSKDEDHEWIDKLRRSLEDAVAVRLRADVPVAIHLSGGLDSSSIAALASAHLPSPPTCFCVAFTDSAQAHGDASYDERSLAEETASHLGATLEIVEASARALALAFPAAIELSEGIAINAHLPAKLLLAQSIRRAGFPVCLSGEGADELLLGYPHLRQDLLNAQGRTTEVDALLAENRASAGLMLAHGEELPVHVIHDALGFVPSWIHAKASLGLRMCSVWRDEVVIDGKLRSRDEIAARTHRAWLSDLIASPSRWPHATPAGGNAAAVLSSRPETSAWLWSKLALSGYILRTLGDGTEMGAGVEGRVPFLDLHVAKVCADMPIDVKIRDGVEKWALRRAMAGLLPSSVLERRKHPFVAPPQPFLENPTAKELLFDTWADPATASIPVIDRRKILALLDRLPNMDGHERKLIDPVLTATLCVAQLSLRLGLS